MGTLKVNTVNPVQSSIRIMQSSSTVNLIRIMQSSSTVNLVVAGQSEFKCMHRNFESVIESHNPNLADELVRCGSNRNTKLKYLNTILRRNALLLIS
jgi:hypothetical protein